MGGAAMTVSFVQVVGYVGGPSGGPAAGRKRVAEEAPRLLEGQEVVLAGPFNANKGHIAAIVAEAGGKLLPRVPPEAPGKVRS